MVNLTPFKRTVEASAKASRKSTAKAIAKPLAALVKARLRTRAERPPEPFKKLIGHLNARTGKFEPLAKPRRAPIRRGRVKAYTPTAKVDISRLGTFRHYMLATIRAHSNTLAAEEAHASCDDPKFAGKKLDFGWAAAEGYITFV